MPHTDLNTCPSPITLQRIAGARWTPYVAATWQNWSRRALAVEGACSNQRAVDCEACRALQSITTLPWGDALGERIQKKAHEALGLRTISKLVKRETVCAPA